MVYVWVISYYQLCYSHMPTLPFFPFLWFTFFVFLFHFIHLFVSFVPLLFKVCMRVRLSLYISKHRNNQQNYGCVIYIIFFGIFPFLCTNHSWISSTFYWNIASHLFENTRFRCHRCHRCRRFILIYVKNV